MTQEQQEEEEEEEEHQQLQEEKSHSNCEWTQWQAKSDQICELLKWLCN